MPQLGVFAPGNYAATYDAVECGITNAPREMRENFFGEEVSADEYGDTIIDYITRGGRCLMNIVFKEWKPPVSQEILYGWNSGEPGLLTPSGLMATDLAKQLVLTAQAGSKAALAGPITITAPQAILSPNQDVLWLLGNTARDIPILFEFLPFEDAADLNRIKFYNTTQPI